MFVTYANVLRFHFFLYLFYFGHSLSQCDDLILNASNLISVYIMQLARSVIIITARFICGVYTHVCVVILHWFELERSKQNEIKNLHLLFCIILSLKTFQRARNLIILDKYSMKTMRSNFPDFIWNGFIEFFFIGCIFS